MVYYPHETVSVTCHLLHPVRMPALLDAWGGLHPGQFSTGEQMSASVFPRFSQLFDLLPNKIWLALAASHWSKRNPDLQCTCIFSLKLGFGTHSWSKEFLQEILIGKDIWRREDVFMEGLKKNFSQRRWIFSSSPCFSMLADLKVLLSKMPITISDF